MDPSYLTVVFHVLSDWAYCFHVILPLAVLRIVSYSMVGCKWDLCNYFAYLTVILVDFVLLNDAYLVEIMSANAWFVSSFSWAL